MAEPIALEKRRPILCKSHTHIALLLLLYSVLSPRVPTQSRRFVAQRLLVGEFETNARKGLDLRIPDSVVLK